MLRLRCHRGPLLQGSGRIHCATNRILYSHSIRLLSSEAEPEGPSTAPTGESAQKPKGARDRSKSRKPWHVQKELEKRAARADAIRPTPIARPPPINRQPKNVRENVSSDSSYVTATQETHQQRQPPDQTQTFASLANQSAEVTDGESRAGLWTSLRERLQAPPREDHAEQDEIQTSSGLSHQEGGEITIPRGLLGGEEAAPAKKGPGGKSKRPAAKAALEVKTIKPQRLRLRPVEEDKNLDVPKLSYDLDRVLFNPGVYHMQDARSRVYNFDPYLASIMPVDEFDFDALRSYITSSKDVKLRQLSQKHGLKYCGSTSSMTSILGHFHFLLSSWRKPCLDHLSRSLTTESLNFTQLTRGPAAAFAQYQDGVYAIDSDKEYDTENILSMLGKSMEKLLTLPKEDFERYRRTRSHQLTEEERNAEESYHYTTLGDFMMRSQLDAHDPRIPGTGMFDLKTRAVVSIRMDVTGYEKGIDYEIRRRFGQWESFEREYYDLIRAAFLKYSLQVRMGRMDGVFVAYHNTQRIFGFQYISLAEMDHALHGTPDPRLGDQEFKASVHLLNELMDRAAQRFPGRSLRLHVETRPTKVPLTYFFVEPVTDEEMQNIQEANKPSIEQLEKEIRGLSNKESAVESAQDEENAQAEQRQQAESEKLSDSDTVADPQNEAAWEDMMSKVDETVENESLGIGSVREALQDALEQSGLLRDKTEVETDQYLDSLVNALTTRSKSKAARDSSEDGVAIEDSESSSTSAESESRSLKDLILKVTEGIDDGVYTLGSSQRAFAELVAKSKQNDATSTDEITNGTDTSETAAGANDASAAGSTGSAEESTPPRELLGMYITIRNKVNGQFVERPTCTESDFDWGIQYTVTELPDSRAQQIYEKIKRRRKTVLQTDPHAKSADWYRMFSGRLPVVTKQGKRYRQERTKQEAGKSIYVAWDKKPLSPEAVSSMMAGTKRRE